MTEKLLILGIGGLVGSKLATISKNDFEVSGTFNFRNPKLDFLESKKIDVTDTDQLEKIIEQTKPDTIINACALHNVDYCENHKDEALAINVDLLKKLVNISKEKNFQIVHISSDSVFDGTKKEPYTEEDLPNPPNFYGETKLQGEKIILEHPKNIVVRASVLYGWLPNNLSTIPSSSQKSTNFAQWLIGQLIKKEPVRIITDELSSPIIAEDFSKAIVHLIKNKKYGLFHLAPDVEISRYDFSVKLAESLNLDVNLIQPITNKELGRTVSTGQNKCLNSSKITKSGFNFMSLDKSFDIIKNQVSK